MSLYIQELKRHLHYLRALKENYSIMQPEVREAIDFAISQLELAAEECR